MHAEQGSSRPSRSRSLVRRRTALLTVLALAVGACGSGGGDDAAGGSSVATVSTDGGSSQSTDSAQPAPSTSPGGTTAPTLAPVPDVVIDGGRVTDEALLAAVAGDRVNGELIAAVTGALMDLPEAERLPVAAELSRRLELEAARITGLMDAIGGEAATDAVLTGAWAQIAAPVDALGTGIAESGIAAAPTATTQPSGFRRAPSAPSADGMAVMGVMMGMMALGMTADATVSAANEAKPGQRESAELSTGTTITGSVEQSGMTMSYEGTQDGVAVTFDATIDVHPCPDPNGKFDITVTIDVHTSKGDASSNATIDMAIDGQVDDDARLAGADVVTNSQWSGGSSGGSQLIDFTSATKGGASPTFTTNRNSGTNDDFVTMAVLMSMMFEAMIKDKVLTAAEKAWTSGRCVELKVTPSAGPKGLDPGAVVDVLAEPRSKVDGTPTGGNVTARLASGGKSVEPDGSPVPADANSTYTAPDEPKKSGSVAYESRSRRGVGRAELAFETSGGAAYLVVGGLEDWQVSQVVCDIMSPFSLTSPGVGVAEFSGGLTGTYSATGVFNFSYAGDYVIALANGIGSPGTMSASSGGSIAGQAGSGTESYVLTPADPCE
jgi:hypothetical protein